MRFAIWLPVVLALVGGCATVSQHDSDWTEAALDAREALRAGEYATAIPRLKTIKQRTGTGRFGEQARLDLIYAYHKQGQHREALQEAAEFIERYPNHPQLAYAFYMRGVTTQQAAQATRGPEGTTALRDEKLARDAFGYFAELVRRFPDSPYTNDAVQRMVELRDTLARRELHLAEQRFKARDYQAAVSRARFVVDQYTGSAAVADALALLVQSYRSLGMTEAAENTFRMLDTNHPDHPAVESLRSGNRLSR